MTIGASDAAVLFSGLVAGLVGVAPGAAVPVTIGGDGITSNAPTIAVQ